ncbi:hypothetical protein B4113_1790 [Geobacillus sp. B4113_201601]|nr:hypothetical protein B4113_1790 [Geobacillus sp. B4113_201601]
MEIGNSFLQHNNMRFSEKVIEDKRRNFLGPVMEKSIWIF